VDIHHPHGPDHHNGRQRRHRPAHVNRRDRTGREDQSREDRRPDGLAQAGRPWEAARPASRAARRGTTHA
jgi:hypothetical protein